jgi:Mn-dependent DtxR family transcriptional regulator
MMKTAHKTNPAEAKDDSVTQKKLDTIIDLLRLLVASEFSKQGVPRHAIAKRLHVAKGTVVEMLKGTRNE